MEITLLYTSLISILSCLFGIQDWHDLGLKTNTLLGAGDSSEMLQSIRAFGNLIEYAPFSTYYAWAFEIARCGIMEASFAWINIFFL